MSAEDPKPFRNTVTHTALIQCGNDIITLEKHEDGSSSGRTNRIVNIDGTPVLQFGGNVDPNGFDENKIIWQTNPFYTSEDGGR